MYVAVERIGDGSVQVRLAEPEHLTRLHVHLEAGVDAALLNLALFESGAAVQARNGEYLISVEWLFRNAGSATDDESYWNDMLDAAIGPDGYVPVLDAISARVYGPRTAEGDPDCTPMSPAAAN